MEAKVYFNTEMTVQKKARVLVGNYDVKGNDCETISLKIPDDQRKSIFGLFKFDELILSGKGRKQEWYPDDETVEYFVFEVEILNFDSLFAKTRPQYFRGEKVNKGVNSVEMPQEFECDFDLISLPDYLKNDYKLQKSSKGNVFDEIIGYGDFE